MDLIQKWIRRFSNYLKRTNHNLTLIAPDSQESGDRFIIYCFISYRILRKAFVQKYLPYGSLEWSRESVHEVRNLGFSKNNKISNNTNSLFSCVARKKKRYKLISFSCYAGKGAYGGRIKLGVLQRSKILPMLRIGTLRVRLRCTTFPQDDAKD